MSRVSADRPSPINGEDPTSEDTEFAEAFCEMAEMVEGHPSPGKMALWLSTCRNHYLTINAQFFDIRHCFGHGAMPSYASIIAYEFSRGSVENLSRPINSLGEWLAAYEDKCDCWERRHDFRQYLESYLAGAPGNTQVRLKNALFKVKTSDGNFDGVEFHWPSKYLELNEDAVSTLDVKSHVLASAALRVRALMDIARAALAYSSELQPTQEDLFAAVGDPDRPWKRLREVVLTSSASLNLIAGSGSDVGVEYFNWKGMQLRIPVEPPDMERFVGVLSALGGILDGIQRDVHQELLEHFRPNQSRPPLPKIFKIDLTPPVEHRIGVEVSLSTHSLDQTRQEEVVVAIASIGVASDRYLENETRIRSQYRQRFQAAASVCLSRAIEAKAQVLVLPELFVPADCANEFFRAASRSGLICIAGVEGGRNERTGRDFNVVGVQFPDRPLVEQYKHFPSKYEHDHLFRKGGLHYFENTTIGNFAVIVCSDYRECNIMDALQRSSKQLDFLFVCANNPKPEQFRHMAIADSYRLYSTIVITDSHETQGFTGSCVVQPRSEDPVVRPDSTIDLAPEISGLGEAAPELQVFRLSLGKLVRKRGMQARGVAPCPFSRRLE